MKKSARKAEGGDGDLVEIILGTGIAAKIVYILVGLGALWTIKIALK